MAEPQKYGLIDFLARNIWIMPALLLVTLVVAIVLFFTEPGKAVYTYASNNIGVLAAVLVLFALMIAAFFILNKPREFVPERKSESETWEAIFAKGGALQDHPRGDFNLITCTRHPIEGKIFHGTIVRGRQPFSLHVSDYPKTVGQSIHAFRTMQTDEETMRYIKREVTIEEKIIQGEQAKLELSKRAGAIEQERERQELWGNSTGA
jgi:hypothetical protein